MAADTRRISPQKLALVKDCIDEGWPIIEITRTYGVTRVTVKRHFPEYRGMDMKEASSMGARIMQLNRGARRTGS